MTEATLGIQGFTADDKRVIAGSRFGAVRDAVFANPYQKVWGAQGNAPLERFPVTFRQVYQIAELGKPPAEPTRAPEFMQLTVASGQPVIPGDDLDFRDEMGAVQ